MAGNAEGIDITVESMRERLKRMTGDRQGGARPAAPAGPPPARFAVERRRQDTPLATPHGCTALAGMWPPGPNFFRLCGLPVPPAEEPPEILFLDTETTGLAGGAGTLAFLVGLSRLSPARDVLRTEQVFLPDPAVEGDFLAVIAAALSQAGLLVCFNGKSYDIPLLNSRFILNGLPPVPENLPVADLLHPARRRWKAALGACDQRTVEHHILGVRRQNDIPGELIPERYFRYLKSRDAAELEDVFHHNFLDMLGMAALFARLNTLLPEEAPSGDPADWACLLGVLDKRNRLSEFEEIYTQHAEALQQAARRHLPAGRILARLLKRTGQRESAWSIHRRLGADRPGECPDCLIEILKFEEHVQKDYPAALEHCDAYENALARIPGAAVYIKDIQRRRERLQGKVRRHGAEPRKPTERSDL